MKINLIEYLNETVERHGQRVAVIDGMRKISFNELVEKAQTLAAEIITKRKCINKPIAVFLPKTIESVYSNLAIIYSGNFYMNIDIKSPEERIKNILNVIKPEIIITNSVLLDSLTPILSASVTVVNVDQTDIKTLYNQHELKT